MKHKKVNLKTVDGFFIAGVHTVSQRKSVILWLHGIAISRDEYLNLFKDGAENVGESGIDSLRIDFRGHGKSSGKSTDFTIAGQMIDTLTAIQYLKSFYKTENINLHVVGCSFGAPPAIFIALKEPEMVKSITLIAPVLSYKRTFLEPETEWAASIFNAKSVAKLCKTNRIYFDDFPIGMKVYIEMHLVKPETLIRKLKQKVTIIHGDADSMVPYKVSKDLSNKYQNINLISIRDMDHGFNDIDDEIGSNEKSLANKNTIFDIVKKTALNE